MDMDEGEDKKPKLRYKGGAVQDTGANLTNPDEVGFGDLVRDEDDNNSLKDKIQKVSNATGKLKPAAANSKALFSRLKTSIKKQFSKLKSSSSSKQRNESDKPVYRRQKAEQTQTENDATITNKTKQVAQKAIFFAKKYYQRLYKAIGTKGVAAVGAVLVLALVVGGRGFQQNTPQEEVTGEVSGVFDASTDNISQLLPLGESAESLDIFNDTGRGIISYQHENNLGEFIVTQQVLPQEFKDAPEKLKNLALSLTAKERIDKFETDKGISYVIEAADSSQTAIFGYQDTLIFVTTPEDISIEDWTNYINSLR